jgi:hypothetical protein
MSNKVKWLHNSIDGPYAGKYDRLTKCTIKLHDDTAGAFFVFYNSLRSVLGSNGFNQELLPALQHINTKLDLSKPPVDIDLPPVGTHGGGEKIPMEDWMDIHNEFSSTLYALLASDGVIAQGATRSSNILVSYQFSGSGCQVLQD